MTIENKIVRASDPRFQNLWNLLPAYEGDTEDWHNGTGYMDNARDVVVDMDSPMAFVDKHGRRGIFGQGVLVMERYVNAEDSILIAHLFNHEGRGGDVHYAESALRMF